MTDISKLYIFGDSPTSLAKKVIERNFEGKPIVFPIDPFDLLSEFGIVYQFRDFEDLEGIYLVPADEHDIPIVGININRPICRQRFTAAHELCHHLKDKNISGEDILCPVNASRKDKKEKYAENFAAELLMPRDHFKSEVEKVEKNGFVEFDQALYLADFFGVSFESCIFALAYRLNKIEGDTDPKSLKARIKKYKPNSRRMEICFTGRDNQLYEQIFNSYKYFFVNDNNIMWYKFKRDFVYNENRIEGIHLEKEEVAEIITDIRLHNQESEYCKSDFQGIIEVAGHSSLYDYICDTEDKISGFSILNLNKMLYQYAPFPDEAGKTRTNNNLVLEAKFETVDWMDIPSELRELDKEVKALIESIEEISLTQYIEEVVRIHHHITVIHPFNDGNGRVARVFLNWLFRIRGLPPVYLKYENKLDYYDALSRADIKGDFTDLKNVFLREIMRSMIQLNSKFEI